MPFNKIINGTRYGLLIYLEVHVLGKDAGCNYFSNCCIVDLIFIKCFVFTA